MTAADIRNLRSGLIAQANRAGGWSYYPGRRSRLEPTSWALMSLGDGSADFDPEPHWRFLLSCQRSSGLLVEDETLPTNVGFNALVAIALLGQPRFRSSPALSALLTALASSAGLQVAQNPNFQQNNSLRGWSWTEGTFSWVEPTCLALIALKKARASGQLPKDAGARIDEAERMVIDRCCRDGGWNYGNANALGKELFPYVAVTAVALLALRDRKEVDAVTRSLRFLQKDWATEPSTISLSLTSISLRRFGLSTDQVDAALTRQLPTTLGLNNLQAMATALYAIAKSTDDTLSV